MRTTGRASRVFLTVFAVAGLSIQFVRPARTNSRTDFRQSLSALVEVPSDAERILERACRDCHSNDTRWPWYSHIAPVSWWVIEHVNHGRSHFNYSHWATYDGERRAMLLERSCSLARGHAMPLGSYLLMHSSAKLSSADIDTLCNWTRTAKATGRAN